MSIYYLLMQACFLLMVSLVAGLSAQQRDIIQKEDPQGFFQYVNIPAYLQYEYGFNRGSPTHQVSRHEQFNNGNFRSKIKWSDGYGGVGGHYFDYNHGSSNSAEYVPEYHIPSYNPISADSNPEATQDAPQSSFGTLFRFPKPNAKV